jgi:hypothetical protein
MGPRNSASERQAGRLDRNGLAIEQRRAIAFAEQAAAAD